MRVMGLRGDNRPHPRDRRVARGSGSGRCQVAQPAGVAGQGLGIGVCCLALLLMGFTPLLCIGSYG